jgi:HD-GYP domain-containing protein (c-di-GMP phosphodiesterase class II)
MNVTLAGTVLTRDLVTADGRKLASRGEVLDLHLLKSSAAKAPKGVREPPLHETAMAEAVLEAFEAPALVHLAGSEESRAQIADAISEVRFPAAIWEELEAMRREDGPRFQHAVWTAVVSARLLRSALGTAPGLSRLIGGALVHDIGMRYSGQRFRFKRDHLTPSDALSLEDHPMIGALVLASSIGESPAMHFALLHHARAGYGYPRVSGNPPLRGLDLVSVASAFSALVAPRSFRSEAYNVRGAVDQLLDEARQGHFDERAIRLLVHCLRGATGPLTPLSFPRQATGYRPVQNHHGVAREPRARA